MHVIALLSSITMSDEIDRSSPTEDRDRPVVQGTDHITVEGSNPTDTIEFYRDLLGMSLVLRQPNLDRPDLTHLFFDTNDGRLLTFFVSDDRESGAASEPDPGDVHHLAFQVEASRLSGITEKLTDAGYSVSEFDRGPAHSVYTHDPNGLEIELVASMFGVPDDHRAEVLAHAHQKRISAGDEFVGEDHVREAIDELDIDVEETALSSASGKQD
jgi:catechol 2,3-dioxygenase-like lactoylglutathione lyase family enzyme